MRKVFKINEKNNGLQAVEKTMPGGHCFCIKMQKCFKNPYQLRLGFLARFGLGDENK